MEKDVSPVPSPPPEAPSPPPDDDDFGILPADSFGSSSEWSLSHKPSIIPTESIRSDIMNALKSVIPPSSTSKDQSAGMDSYTSSVSSSSNVNQQTVNASPGIAQYDASMGGSMPSLATMQQQFQQSWGGNTVDNFAAMSAMSNMIQQTNNYLQMQQAFQNTNYGGTGSGYETYQPQSIQHPPLPNLDLGSIPLPPISDPPAPPPITPQETPQAITSHMQQHNSQNPYLQSSMETSSSAIDNEYIPYQPQQQHSNFSDSNRYESQYTPATPTGPSQSERYHPYRNRNSENKSDRLPPILNSPTGNSNSSGGGTSMFLNSKTPLASERPASVGFDPMEMFHSALSKTRSGGQQSGGIQSVLESPVSPAGHASVISNRSMSSDSSPSQTYGHSQNPFSYGGGTAGMYDSFDEPEIHG